MLKMLVMLNILLGVPLWVYSRALENTLGAVAAGYLIASATGVILAALVPQLKRRQQANG